MNVAVLAETDSIIGGHVISSLLKAGVPIAVVIIDQKAAAPRDHAIHFQRTGGKLPPVDLKQACGGQVPQIYVPDHNGSDGIAVLREMKIDIAVNGGTPRVLKSGMLSVLSSGVLNCHPGLLPSFRGSSAVEWALFLNEPIGNTVHLMDERIDEGPILRRGPIVVPHGSSYQDVRVQVFRSGFDLLADVCADFASGRLRLSDAQPQEGGRYFRPIDDVSLQDAIRRLESGRFTGGSPLGKALMES